MKNIWIIANWKSNKTIAEALDWISLVGPKLPRKENLPAGRQVLKVVVCPTFASVEEVKKQVQVGNYPLMVGSQDLSPFDSGAFTGEESARILRDFVELSILGHSERRQNFGETDQMVAEKVKQAKSSNITPLVCVQNADGEVPEGCLLVAYEPPNAISSSGPNAKADTPKNASQTAEKLKQRYGNDLEVLYGGSVNSQNCKGFLLEDNLNGLLIGKASLDPEEFVKIVEEAASF